MQTEEPAGEERIIHVEPHQAGERLDKTLADLLADVSRARLQALIAAGALTLDGKTVTDASHKAQAGDYHLLIPPPTPAEPKPEAIPLTVLYEDAHLIVVDKAAGMAAHPAPGTYSGTLVNALLHHCGDSLSGVGGVARPGIVHRLDKDTSGVMVAAKTDAAHAGLSALFATHDIERVYIALTRGAPTPPKGTIASQIGRSPNDRKKMATLRAGGREAITHYAVARRGLRPGPGRPRWRRECPASWKPAARTRSACIWRRKARRCWETPSMAPARSPRPSARRSSKRACSVRRFMRPCSASSIRSPASA